MPPSTPTFWSKMYSTTHIDPDTPPSVTRFLYKKPLCGHCKFKCCNSPSLNVECTEQEASNLELPIIFPQEGQCRCLIDTGCKHGVNRPVFCQLFPLQVTKDNKLVLSYWSILNCPMASDYTLDSFKNPAGRYTYKLRKGISGAKRNNSNEVLLLDKPLEEFPNCLDNNHEALVRLYGDEGSDEILRRFKTLEISDRGMGLV